MKHDILYKHLLCCILFYNLFFHANATIEIRSEPINTTNGLVDNSVKYIHQDNKGFLWIGTLNGISRYDGRSFINFQPNEKSKVSLADHRIKNISEDTHGYLWISTYSDIFSCFDLKKDCFIDFTCHGKNFNHYRSIKITDATTWLWGKVEGFARITYKNGSPDAQLYSKEEGNLPTNNIKFIEEYNEIVYIGTDKGLFSWKNNKLTCINRDIEVQKLLFHNGKVLFITNSGELWISTDNIINKVGALPVNNFTDVIQIKNRSIFFTSSGTYSFNMDTSELSPVLSDLHIPNARTVKDNKGNYWAYNNSGKLYYINSSTAKIITINIAKERNFSSTNKEEYHIVQDSRNLIWISTFGHGLFVFNPTTNRIQQFTANDTRSAHLRSNNLQFLMEDRSGTLWVCSEYSGISHISILNEGSIRLFPSGNPDVSSKNSVRMVTKDENNDVWVSTNNGELFKYDGSVLIKKENKKSEMRTYAICNDINGKYWIGTRKLGLFIDGKQYVNDLNNDQSLSSNSVYCILKDSKNRMWIGTFGGGLNLATQENGNYKFRSFLRGEFGQRWIRCMIEDKNGYIWVGTSGGIYIFNPDEMIKNSNKYYSITKDNAKLNCNEIRSIFQDKRGRIWIAESGSGFCVCENVGNYNNIILKHYNISSGLVSNMVQSFVEDEYERMWISTEYGISCFNIKTESFNNFFFSDIMLGNVYSENSATRLNDGRLGFGSNNGLLVIDPKLISLSRNNSIITFTDIKLNGISATPGTLDSPINSTLAYENEINLKYFQNSFTIEFSTLNYSNTNSTKFSYKLENYDEEWSTPSILNFASYKNINPGHYNLKVKVFSSDIIDGEEANIDIIITPPFWRSNIAFIIYVILLLIITYVIIRICRKISLLRNRIEIEKQVTEYKLAFFTNVSHEFRTPLTLIEGAVERIKESRELSNDMAFSIKIMDKSSKRLLRLINQLIEFRKVYSNNLSLSLEKTDIIFFTYDIFLNFKEEAHIKNIKYEFICELTTLFMYIDKDKIDKAIYNLLSNAIKYTPCGGAINLTITKNEKEDSLIIQVIDTGVGIPKEKRDDVFKKFMHTSLSRNSMGLGLYLTKELINFHKGSLTYEPNNKKGSIFTITLSTNISIYRKEDFCDLDKHYVIESSFPKTQNINSQDEFYYVNPINKHKILIIEDDNDIRDFLTKEIGKYFEVMSQESGLKAQEIAKREMIDLIVCDVLLPGMSGYEIAKQLKSDIHSNHIPIILLTALNSLESNLEGINSGADIYMTKPFNIKILIANISRLINERKKLRDKFVNDPHSVHSTICLVDKEKEFANRLFRMIESNFSNPNLSIDELATQMGLGRTLFYSRVREITGYSPSEYIRIVRMRKAAQLLLETNLTINEVTYKVGINNPFYFSRCFKNQFGVTPSVYQKGEKSHNIKL